jgi:hypothetical protein
MDVVFARRCETEWRKAVHRSWPRPYSECVLERVSFLGCVCFESWFLLWSCSGMVSVRAAALNCSF